MAGISETWTADNGIWYDEDEKIWLIYEGLHETETNKGKVHCGIGFMLNQRAFQLWKKSGRRINMQSARVGTIHLDIRDTDDNITRYP
jgi:hypothetical protein